MKRFAIALAAFTALVVACSSSEDTPATTPDDPDSGSSGSSSGTSGTSGGPTDAAPTDSASAADAADAADANVPFAITSTAFTEGGPIDLAQAQTCNNGSKMIKGSNQSPPLAWTSGPAGTLSYALELHDATNNLLHAVSYDIPATLRALPGSLPNSAQPADFTPNPPGGGMKQAKNISNTFGYAGPCPPVVHTYEFVLYALDIATLPGTDMTTTRPALDTAIKAHMLASTKLTGTFTP